MARRDTQVCCCGATKWTNVIAGLHVDEALCSIVVFFFVKFRTYPPEIVTGQKEILHILDKHNMELLIYSAIHLVLAILLYTGNKKDSIGLLRTWVFILLIGNIGEIVGFFVVIGNSAGPIIVLSLIFSVVFSVFSMAVVCQRINDTNITLGASNDVESPMTQDHTV